MAMDDDDQRVGRQLFVGLGALLAVALFVGGVVSVMALGAASVSGIGEVRADASEAPSLYFPDSKPTPEPEPYADIKVPQSASPSPSASPSASPKPRKPKPRLTLQVFPGQVSPGERINLTGVYPGGEGRVLQVQRLEGGAWNDFPVDARVVGGSFQTWIATGHTGPQQFRMLDLTSGTHSNTAKVVVG